MNVQKEIFQLILDKIIKNPDITISTDTDLLNDIGLDSVGLILLVVLIEEKFGIQLPDEFLTSENLSKINNIVLMVQALTNKKS